MKIALDYRKSIEKNAQDYFEKSKQAKKKLAGAREALQATKQRLEEVKAADIEAPPSIDEQQPRDRDWYEKYHWCFSSDGFLIIGGRDAATNEMVIKKHAQDDDLVFHTDMAGSPFVLVKAEGNTIPDTTKTEAATFTLAYSKAWKRGLKTADVFHVSPDQVSKEAQAGEYLPKGSFMIYGDTTYIEVEMNFAVGNHDGRAMGGPLTAVSHHCDDYVEVRQGRDKTSDVAKQIRHHIGGDLDDIIRILPAGGVTLA